MVSKIWLYFFAASLFISGLYLLIAKPVNQHESEKKEAFFSLFVFRNISLLQHEVHPLLLRIFGLTLVGISLIMVWMIIQGD